MILSLEQNDSASGLVPFVKRAVASLNALFADRHGNGEHKAVSGDKHGAVFDFVFCRLVHIDGQRSLSTHRLVPLLRATAKHGEPLEKVNALRGLTA